MPHQRSSTANPLSLEVLAEGSERRTENEGLGPPQVGQRWKVAWRDGTVHLAEIVEFRKAGGDSDTPTAAAADTPTSTANGTAGGGAGAGAGAAVTSE
ncbi:unnamed protein product, partial [Pylaiella littoralis]